MLRELTPDERNKSYSKYYDLELTSPHQEKMSLIAKGPGNPDLALRIEDRNTLLDEGDLPSEFGYYLLDDGTAVVENRTFMPNVTGRMLEWWFAWHALDPLRYSIWDKEDHFGIEVGEETKSKILDPSVPLREKSWGVTHKVLESTGGPVSEIEIMFKYPGDLGFDQTKIGTAACSFMVCANGLETLPDGKKAAAVMVHMARDVEGGVDFRSRFFMGYHIRDEVPVKLIPPGMKIPGFIPEGLLAHNVKEYTHLASILPKLYEEEKGRW